MTWWTGAMVRMLREIAVSVEEVHDGRRTTYRKLSGREIAYRINVAFGTWFTADAVRRQAAAQGIKLHGKGGGPKGNTNAANAERHRLRDSSTGRFTSGRTADQQRGEDRQASQRARTAEYRRRRRLAAEPGGDRGAVSMAVANDGD